MKVSTTPMTETGSNLSTSSTPQSTENDFSKMSEEQKFEVGMLIVKIVADPTEIVNEAFKD